MHTIFRQKDRFIRLVNWSIAAAMSLCLAFTAQAGDETGAQGLKLTPHMQKELGDIPGKEGLMISVEFPPGYMIAPHRHDAHVFVYMLEGSMEMQVEGGQPVTLLPGDTFYENPQDVHSVARNLSGTKPARILVFFVKTKDVPPVLPVEKN